MDRLKTCPQCLHQLPASEFRHKGGKGSRRSMCGGCNAEYHRSYRRRRRGERLGKFVAGINRSRRTRAVFRLVEEVSRQFGGPEQLAEAWFDSLQEARRQRPGSATVLRSFMAIAKLAPLARKAQEGIPGQRSFQDWLNTATEEELEEAIDQLVGEAIDRCLAEQYGLGDPLVDPDSPAADPEAESDEGTDPRDAGGCAFAEGLPAG